MKNPQLIFHSIYVFRFIGFTTDKGIIGVYLLNFEAQEPIVVTSQCEETKDITFMEWKNEEQHLFIGNKKGIVSIVFIDMLFVSIQATMYTEFGLIAKNIAESNIDKYTHQPNFVFGITNRSNIKF